jgi:hypothetical protein
MGTDSTYGSGERQGSEDDLHGFPVLALSNESHISVSIYLVGAAIGAGGAITLVYRVSPWDGLSVRFIGGHPKAHALIELTGHGYRANLGTVAAASAFVQTNVARSFSDLNLEASHLSGYTLHRR